LSAPPEVWVGTSLGKRSLAGMRPPRWRAIRRERLPRDVEVVRGDVLDPASLEAAVRGRDAVICALGTPSPRRRSSLLEEGTRNLVVAVSKAGVRRLVGVTLLGVGTSRASASLFYGGVILRVLAPMVPDKERQEQVVRDSDLEWVLVRPGRFVAAKPRGDLRVLREGERGRFGHVVRADLARFLVDCAVTDVLRARSGGGGLVSGRAEGLS
jgi:uncharacterized protein YbjT (DUF2867 family)